MRKHRMALHATWHNDSQTLSYYVERETDDGLWELWSEGTSMPLSGVFDAFVELQELLKLTTAVSLSSTNRTSDVG